MPEFTGSTDEKHVFTLPSEIERVRWLRQQAAPKGQVGLQIRTLFCAIGSQIKIKIEDAQGTVHNTLSGELPDDELNLTLRVPEGAVGGLLAKVEMPNHGLSAESEALKVVEPVRPYGARWSQETVKRGDIVDLSAEVRGAPDGRKAPVRIFKRDPSDLGAHDPFTRLRPRVEGEAVQVKYRFQYPGDTADIVPEWEASEGYQQPEFFYTVNVSGRIADSKNAKSQGIMTFVDDLTLQVVDATSGAPHADQKTKITLADGSTKSKTTNGSGMVELKEIPPGPAKVKLPELGGAAEEPVEAPDGARQVIAKPPQAASSEEGSSQGESSQGSTLSTQVATGSTWRVWAARGGGALPTG